MLAFLVLFPLLHVFARIFEPVVGDVEHVLHRLIAVGRGGELVEQIVVGVGGSRIVPLQTQTLRFVE